MGQEHYRHGLSADAAPLSLQWGPCGATAHGRARRGHSTAYAANARLSVSGVSAEAPSASRTAPLERSETSHKDKEKVHKLYMH